MVDAKSPGMQTNALCGLSLLRLGFIRQRDLVMRPSQPSDSDQRFPPRIQNIQVVTITC